MIVDIKYCKKCKRVVIKVGSKSGYYCYWCGELTEDKVESRLDRVLDVLESMTDEEIVEIVKEK